MGILWDVQWMGKGIHLLQNCFACWPFDTGGSVTWILFTLVIDVSMIVTSLPFGRPCQLGSALALLVPPQLIVAVFSWPAKCDSSLFLGANLELWGFSVTDAVKESFCDFSIGILPLSMEVCLLLVPYHYPGNPHLFLEHHHRIPYLFNVLTPHRTCWSQFLAEHWNVQNGEEELLGHLQYISKNMY